MSKIYGMVGSIGSGKDTAAKYLTSVPGWNHLSFAGPLKDAVAVIFGWPRDLLEGHTDQSRLWRDQVDTWWAPRLNIPHFSPRWALQHIGTDVMRQHFHNDIWIARVEQKISVDLMSGFRVVISDCRFPNEFALIQQLGGQLIEIRRGASADTQPWFWCARQQNLASPQQLASLQSQGQTMEALYPEVHPSEWSWAGLPVDQVLDNSGTIEQLHRKLDQLIIHSR